jgi:hypothetical protein
VIALAVLLAILTIFAAGCGVTLALWRKPQPILVAEFFGLAWLLGAAVVSASLALGGIFLSGPALFGVVATITILLGILGVKRARDGVVIASGLSAAPRWEKWFGLLALLPVLYFGALTFRDSLIWDGFVIWEAKARHAFLAGGSLPAAYFSDATRVNYHPSYPLYLPFTELWVYLWVGDCHQTAVKVLFPVFYAAAIALLWSGAFRLSGRPWVAALTALLPLFVPWMCDAGHGLLQGYADFILGTVYLGGVSALLVWRFRDIAGAWPIAVACAATLPWIKHDGLLLFASLVLLAALAHGWRGWTRSIVFAMPGVAVLVGWRVFLNVVEVVQAATFHPLTLENLLANLPRLGQILSAMGAQFALVKAWSLLWFGVPVALLCLAFQRRRETLILALAILVPLTLDVVPYIFTTLDLRFHLATSLDRLILQVSLVAALCVGLAFEGPRTPPPCEPS